MRDFSRTCVFCFAIALVSPAAATPVLIGGPSQKLTGFIGRVEGIRFAPNQPTLLPESFFALDRLAEALLESPLVRIEIAGHTDNLGLPDENQKLSRLRAEAVKAYLEQKGIAPSHLVAVGLGSERPIADNTIAVGRAQNRRVEIRILPDEQTTLNVPVPPSEPESGPGSASTQVPLPSNRFPEYGAQNPTGSAGAATPMLTDSPAAAAPVPIVYPSLTDSQIAATLALLRNKGLINEKEYQAAMQGRRLDGEQREQQAPRPVTSKWDLSLYGFVELDTIYDTTQSFNELAGNALIARPDTYAGNNGRLQFTLRNSRLGFNFSTPEFLRASVVAKLEFDLLGNQPPGATEIQTFVNDTIRIRHAYLELQTPWINLLFGQTWQLFGWQSYFHPATVAIQGVPGQLYSRAPQIRLSHLWKREALSVELAGALSRAPQRDAWLPDGQGGLRLFFNKWKGMHSAGSTGTTVDAATVGISGTVRQFTLPALSAMPAQSTDTQSTLGWGVAIDALLPIVPTPERRAWALTLSASFSHGTGIADFYTGLTGGVASQPSPPLPKGTPAPNIDNGLALYTSDSTLMNPSLATVDWQSFLVGLQLYLPPRGKLWLSSYFSEMDSANATSFLAPNPMTPGTKSNHVFTQSRWADVNLFVDPLPGLRFGLEYSWFWQQYEDQVSATNHRFQFSAFYIF